MYIRRDSVTGTSTASSSTSSKSSSSSSSSGSSRSTSSGSNPTSSHLSSSSSSSPASRSADKKAPIAATSSTSQSLTFTSSSSMTSSKGSSTSKTVAAETGSADQSNTSSSTRASSTSSSSKSKSSSSSSTVASSSSRPVQSIVSPSSLAPPSTSQAPPAPASSASTPAAVPTSQTSTNLLLSTAEPLSASSVVPFSQPAVATTLALGTSPETAPTTLLMSTPAGDATMGAALPTTSSSPLVIGTFSGTASGTAAAATPSNSELNATGFLKRPGAVVGTFVGVGIILAAAMAFAICFWQRRKRRQRGEYAGSTFRWPPSTPGALSYSDLPMPIPDSPPPMESFATDINRKPSVVWGPRPTSEEDAAMTHEGAIVEPSPPATAHTPHEPRGVGLTRVESRGSAEYDPFADPSTSPFADLHAAPPTTGLAITTGHALLRQSTHSFALSSPSLYSMRTAPEEDGESFYEAHSGMDRSTSRSGQSHSNPRTISPPTTVSYSPQPPSPNLREALKPMMSEVTRIQGHQMVRSGPSRRY